MKPIEHLIIYYIRIMLINLIRSQSYNHLVQHNKHLHMKDYNNVFLSTAQWDGFLLKGHNSGFHHTDSKTLEPNCIA